MYQVTRYDEIELLERALMIPQTEEVPELCNGGPFCPRCRIADAKSALDRELQCSMTEHDSVMFSASFGIKWRGETKEDADKILRNRIKFFKKRKYTSSQNETD